MLHHRVLNGKPPCRRLLLRRSCCHGAYVYASAPVIAIDGVKYPSGRYTSDDGSCVDRVECAGAAGACHAAHAFAHSRVSPVRVCGLVAWTWRRTHRPGRSPHGPRPQVAETEGSGYLPAPASEPAPAL